MKLLFCAFLAFFADLFACASALTISNITNLASNVQSNINSSASSNTSQLSKDTDPEWKWQNGLDDIVSELLVPKDRVIRHGWPGQTVRLGRLTGLKLRVDDVTPLSSPTCDYLYPNLLCFEVLVGGQLADRDACTELSISAAHDVLQYSSFSKMRTSRFAPRPWPLPMSVLTACSLMRLSPYAGMIRNGFATYADRYNNRLVWDLMVWSPAHGRDYNLEIFMDNGDVVLHQSTASNSSNMTLR